MVEVKPNLITSSKLQWLMVKANVSDLERT